MPGGLAGVHDLHRTVRGGEDACSWLTRSDVDPASSSQLPSTPCPSPFVASIVEQRKAQARHPLPPSRGARSRPRRCRVAVRDLAPPVIMGCGATAGVMYWLAIFPVDVVKSAMMTDNIDPAKRQYPTMAAAFKVGTPGEEPGRGRACGDGWWQCVRVCVGVGGSAFAGALKGREGAEPAGTCSKQQRAAAAATAAVAAAAAVPGSHV
jgi:hypothetical protein